MTLNITASNEIVIKLEKLFNIWGDWDENEQYYLHTLLPDLMKDPCIGESQERKIIGQIKQIATQEEWDNLEQIAEEVYHQRNNDRKVEENLGRFFAVSDFKGAKQYIAGFPELAFQDLYERKKQKTINHLMREIKIYLGQKAFEKAEQKFLIIEDYVSDEVKQEYRQYYNKERDTLIHETIGKIKELCEKYNFSEIKPLHQKISDWVAWEEIEPLILAAEERKAKEKRQQFVNQVIEEIKQLLERYEFTKADEKYALIKGEYSKAEYQAQIQFYREMQKKKEIIASIHSMLKNRDFSGADRLYKESIISPEIEYIKMKSPYVRKYIYDHFGIGINFEKAEALSIPAKNLLLSARAGSGKTTVLACKAGMLIDTENVNPDQILVMAFNKDAAREIGERIEKACKDVSFENARTFHSLAYQLVQPEEELLFDINENDLLRKQTKFVQDILKESIHNPVFIEKMYGFFRKELLEFDHAGYFLDDEDYVEFRRNIPQITLNFEKVKSVGEKYIADYLFEHDISYGYEKVWLWGKEVYRPDFSVYSKHQKDYVIEHWGIDENDPAKSVPATWKKTWDDYHEEMIRKRAFWKVKGVPLIETSIVDLRFGRERFEEILEERFSTVGIKNEKLTTAELVKKIQENDSTITHMAELFLQFIQRAKRQMLSAKDLQEKIEAYQSVDEREAAFLDLAPRVYEEYEDQLVAKNSIDFDDLMLQAIDLIIRTKADCSIKLGKSKDREIRMKDLQWILIDEFQDFSKLFYELVMAIKKCNPDIKLFCVGDDWQAINGFAGSDLQFFNQYQEWIEESQVAYLLTNFRSKEMIVHAGNKLMASRGKPCNHLPENVGGDVKVDYMDESWVELRNGNPDLDSDDRDDDERFKITYGEVHGNTSQSVLVIASKYLKKCYEIIAKPENGAKSVLILSRTNRIDGVILSMFKKKLLSCFSFEEQREFEKIENRIQIQTAHKSKGREADLVIVLGACDGLFPLVHPDNALFSIFSRTILDAVEEERRLFYVALTRAKSSLYIITEKNRESAFLSELLAT